MRIILLLLTVFATPVFADEPITRTINLGIEIIYHQEVERAMKRAPTGKTASQLRQAAQVRSNELFLKATRLYKIQIRGPKLMWGLLRSGVAGETTMCTHSTYYISLNEILFFRNFDAAINDYIPHEVAHIVACFVHPEITKEDDFDVHGPEWQAIAKSLGSKGEKYHELDTTPTALYYIRTELLEATDQDKIDSLQKELDEMIEYMENVDG